MQPRTSTASATLARPVAPPQPTAERPAEKPVDLALHAPKAQSVVVAATFNGWDTKRTPLRKGKNGDWKTTVWLPPGRYEYRFVVDGQWMSDPAAKTSVHNNFGSTNSVLEVQT